MYHPYVLAVGLAGTLLVSAFGVVMKVAGKEGFTDVENSFFGCKFRAKK